MNIIVTRINNLDLPIIFSLENFPLLQQGGQPVEFWNRCEDPFDVRYKNSNTFNEFWISDQRTYIQPRTILLKVAYKL